MVNIPLILISLNPPSLQGLGLWQQPPSVGRRRLQRLAGHVHGHGRGRGRGGVQERGDGDATATGAQVQPGWNQGPSMQLSIQHIQLQLKSSPIQSRKAMHLKFQRRAYPLVF